MAPVNWRIEIPLQAYPSAMSLKKVQTPDIQESDRYKIQ